MHVLPVRTPTNIHALAGLSPTSELVLATGAKIPVLGFGTWRLTGPAARSACLHAHRSTGLRLFDTADFYQNHAMVGEAMRELVAGGTERANIVVVTKIWIDSLGYEATRAAIPRYLAELGLTYIDLLLIHYPGASGLDVKDRRSIELRHGSWRAMEEAVDAGSVRMLGVSNFTETHLDALLQIARIRPVVNQVECHCMLQQRALRAYCARPDINIAVMAYCPLARGRLLDHPVLLELARTHHVTPAQVAIRWVLQNNMLTVPKSQHTARIDENADVFGFVLTGEEMGRLDAITQEARLCWDERLPEDQV